MSLPTTYKALISYGPGKEPKIEEVPLQKPGKNQILVKVAFAPVNPSDIYTSQGAYPVNINPPHPVGLEGSGVVVAVGEDLKVPHQVGDRVHIITVGTYGQYVLAQADECRKVQANLSLEEAASHYVNPATVVIMGDVVKKAGVKTVIHTAGSSALGRMFIRYFKHQGIKTINIVRRDEFIDDLKKEGADYVLNSQKPGFEQQLKEISHKEEATIAFDALAGDFTQVLLRNLPDNSTCYVYGGLGGFNISNVTVSQLVFEGKAMLGLWLTTYLKQAEKRREAERLLNESYGLLTTVLSSSIQKVFKLEDFKEAIAYHKEHSSKGKILVQPN